MWLCDRKALRVALLALAWAICVSASAAQLKRCTLLMRWVYGCLILGTALWRVGLCVRLAWCLCRRQRQPAVAAHAPTALTTTAAGRVKRRNSRCNLYHTSSNCPEMMTVRWPFMRCVVAWCSCAATSSGASTGCSRFASQRKKHQMKELSLYRHVYSKCMMTCSSCCAACKVSDGPCRYRALLADTSHLAQNCYQIMSCRQQSETVTRGRGIPGVQQRNPSMPQASHRHQLKVPVLPSGAAARARRGKQTLS